MSLIVLGIDIGGSAVKYAPVQNGALLEPVRRLSTPAGLTELLETVSGLIHTAAKEWDIAGAGIGVPGFMRRPDGVITRSPNLLFLNGTAFAAEISRRIRPAIAVENDANCAAIGVWAARPAPRPHSLVHLTLGTGVGSGIVLDGRPWHGACGFAAELGHLVVNAEGRSCGCSGRGCAETEISETGILRSWAEIRPDSSVRDARKIHELLLAGDPDARAVFSRAGRYLGILLADIANCLNPEVITLGGGVAAAEDALLAPARTELSARLHRDALDCTRIETVAHEDFGVLGAAYMFAKDSRA